MKRILLPLLLCALPLPAQEYQEAQRGPHHALWQRTVREVDPEGEVRERIESFKEIATGLHYLDERGALQRTIEEFQIVNGVAMAVRGPHKVLLNANVNTENCLDVSLPDGQRLVGGVVGLMLIDTETGASVPLAAVKNREGAVLPPNEVYYLDAFDGLLADIRYVYRRDGIEQDVILREAPPPPEAFGLDPKTTALAVVTSFIQAPEPGVENVPARGNHQLADQRLSFGSMRITRGRAFSVGVSDRFTGIPVAKSWQREEGRNYLIEQVHYPAIEPQLRDLRRAQVRADRPQARMRTLAQAFPERTAGVEAVLQLARIDSVPREGFTIDFNLQSSESSFVFQGDTTYLAVGGVVLDGTTVIEGGAVIKFTNYSAAPYLQFDGPILCRTSDYRPAVFTGIDDDTIGTVLPGSTGNPEGKCYAALALYLASSTDSYHLKNLHIRYADLGIVPGNKSVTLEHVQLGFCTNAVFNFAPDLRVRNGLIHDSVNAFLDNTGSTNRCENVTFDGLDDLLSAAGSGATNRLCLTNCLIANVSGGLTFLGVNNATNTAGFTTVGEGARYLTPSSPYRDAGTTNIHSDLLTALRKRTTYPPLLLTNNVVVDTTLAPQAQRDTDVVDIGWHYAPIDYVAHNVIITNATLYLTNGVVMATRGPASGFALGLHTGGNLHGQGNPTALNRLVRYSAVQERANASWSTNSVAAQVKVLSTGTPKPGAYVRFTEWSLPGGEGYHFHASLSGASTVPVGFQDCQFGAGNIFTRRQAQGITNSLFERVSFVVEEPSTSPDHFIYNNLFWNGSLDLEANDNDNWHLYDNLFFQAEISTTGDQINHGYNGYITNYDRLTPAGTGDVVLTNLPAFLEGALGRFCYPTNDGMLSLLIDAGSRNTTNAGLYHFTVHTNNAKETNSIVDVGFHYVAVDANGLAIDTDSDGVPDYLEDLNGNGSVDSGETDWEEADTDGDGMSDFLELLLGRDPLVYGTAAESSGQVKLRVYTPLE